MSLISIENFAAPFQNKVHLVTIFIVAAVFGVLRMQGGGVSIDSNTPIRRGATQYERVAPAAQAAPKANTYQRSAPANTRPAPNQQGGGSSLDDIERSLGLR